MRREFIWTLPQLEAIFRAWAGPLAVVDRSPVGQGYAVGIRRQAKGSHLPHYSPPSVRWVKRRASYADYNQSTVTAEAHRNNAIQLVGHKGTNMGLNGIHWNSIGGHGVKILVRFRLHSSRGSFGLTLKPERDKVEPMRRYEGADVPC